MGKVRVQQNELGFYPEPPTGRRFSFLRVLPSPSALVLRDVSALA